MNKVNALIQSFRSSVEFVYHQSFDLIALSSKTNELMSSLFSNIQLRIQPGSTYLRSSFRHYANRTCSCHLTSSCIEPLTIQFSAISSIDSSVFFTIPGLFRGCIFVEAIRQSSLECFYSASCITTIIQCLPTPPALNKYPLALNSSIKSQFNISSSLDQLLSKAMIEHWKQDVSHVQYYLDCHVPTCTYTFASRFNIIYIVTTIIAFVGGLTKILRLFIPPIVKFIRRRLSPPSTISDTPR